MKDKNGNGKPYKLTKKTKRVRFKCESDEPYSESTIITLTPTLLDNLNEMVEKTRYSRCSLVRVALSAFVNKVQGKGSYQGVHSDERRIREKYQNPSSGLMIEEAESKLKKLVSEIGVDNLNLAIQRVDNGSSKADKKLVAVAA